MPAPRAEAHRGSMARMCGRFTQLASWPEVADFLRPLPVLPGPESPGPSWNLAPSQPCRALRCAAEGSALEGVAMRWGLIPAWARAADRRWNTFNARAESMATKPSFRAAFRHRRCLVPASGYYEWSGEKGRRQPYCIRPEDVPLLLFAALWEPPRPESCGLPSLSIVTREACGPLRALHERMPAMVPPGEAWTWCTGPTSAAMEIACAAKIPRLVWQAVDRQLDRQQREGPEAIPARPPGL